MEFTTKSPRVHIAMLALLAVMATPAFAADDATETVVATAVKIDADDRSRELAENANKEAAEEAAEAVLSDTQLDLDIRLIGPTSVTIARDR